MKILRSIDKFIFNRAVDKCKINSYGYCADCHVSFYSWGEGSACAVSVQQAKIKRLKGTIDHLS